MNKEQFTAIMRIIKKLKWENMPAYVALDAVQTIVNNYISGALDCTEYSMSEDTALDIISNYLDENTIWLFLFIYDYDTTYDEEMHQLALSLRWEIEHYMRLGDTFAEARREWDI